MPAALNARPIGCAENPGYDGVRSVFLNHGCELQPIGLETDGINLFQLAASRAKLVYITPSHQFRMDGSAGTEEAEIA